MRLSIITINFNNRIGFEHTIESVNNQISSEIEYIIIDGGSTDGSLEIIKQHQSKIHYWVSEPDNGIYNAMNKGAKVATGDYLYYLNSGDYLVDNDVVSEIITEIDTLNSQNNRLDVFVGSTKQEGFKEWISPPDVITLYHMFKSTLPHQAVFMPRERVLKFPFREDYKIISDWIQMVDVIREGVLDFHILSNKRLIAINEPFGTCSEDNIRLEKIKYMDENYHVFRRFEDFDLVKYKLDLFRFVKSANFINKILWKIMMKLAKSTKNNLE